jgi:hypothetical protein
MSGILPSRLWRGFGWWWWKFGTNDEVVVLRRRKVQFPTLALLLLPALPPLRTQFKFKIVMSSTVATRGHSSLDSRAIIYEKSWTLKLFRGFNCVVHWEDWNVLPASIGAAWKMRCFISWSCCYTQIDGCHAAVVRWRNFSFFVAQRTVPGTTFFDDESHGGLYYYLVTKNLLRRK